MTARKLWKRLFTGPRQEAEAVDNLLQGGIEVITPSLVAGWVHHPLRALCDVRLLAGPHLLAQARIAHHRPDVEEDLQKTGLFGFQLEIPADLPLLRFEAPPLVLALSADGSQRFPLSFIGSRPSTQARLLAALDPERRGLRGHFDGLTPDGSQLHGWCYKVGAREPAKVWLQAQDRPPRDLICQQARPGMADQGHVEVCGFRLAIADWPEAAGASIWATFDAEGLLRLPQISPVQLPPLERLEVSLPLPDQEPSSSFTDPVPVLIEPAMEAPVAVPEGDSMAGGDDPALAGQDQFVNQDQSVTQDQSVNQGKPASDYVSEIALAISTNSWAEANQGLDEALALYPNHLDLLLTANSLNRARLDYDAAVDYAKEIIREHPDFFDGYCRAAQDLAFHLDRREEALATISIGLERCPHEMWTLWTAFLIYSATNQDARALELGQQLVELHPSFAPIYPLLTTLLLKSRETLKAEQLVETGFANLPTDSAIIRLKLELLLRQGQRFAYRNWLYCLAKQSPETFPEFFDYIHRFEVLSRDQPLTQRNHSACDVCCVASDEAPYIAEFIHHYLFLGFANIFVGINNTTDKSEEIVRRISSSYSNVHVLDVNHVQSTFAQFGCYRVLFDYARRQSQSKYCLFVDVDEFWVADPFPKSIGDFLSEKPLFDVYSFHWIFCFGEAPFAPPLTPPQEYVWDPHVKSMCSYDVDLIDVRAHAPLLSFSEKHSCMRGQSTNKEITFTMAGLDVHQIADDYESSPIGLPGGSWILHRIFRSEIEYCHSLFKKNVNDPGNPIFKNNRNGYHLYPSTAGAQDYLTQVLPSPEIAKYHQSLDAFIAACGILPDITEARSLISEEEIYKRLNSLTAEELMRESALMSSIFSGTRFSDWHNRDA